MLTLVASWAAIALPGLSRWPGTSRLMTLMARSALKGL
jgi:hypothetical protein